MPQGIVSHSEISRALASLGERAGAAEVAAALSCAWEPFEAQMRRRMRTRPREKRTAYLCLARAGAEKVRVHLEETGVIPRDQCRSRRRVGIVVRVGHRTRRRELRSSQRRAGSRREVRA